MKINLTKKQKAWAASGVIISAGAALLKWVDVASGVALMGVGIWMVGKLGREWFPESPAPVPVQPEISTAHETKPPK